MNNMNSGQMGVHVYYWSVLCNSLSLLYVSKSDIFITFYPLIITFQNVNFVTNALTFCPNTFYAISWCFVFLLRTMLSIEVSLTSSGVVVSLVFIFKVFKSHL